MTEESSAEGTTPTENPPPEGSPGDTVELTVEARAHGWRLDHYLTRIYPSFSRAAFQRSIADDGVQVNGVVAKAARRLHVNDRLSVKLPVEPDSRIQPEDVPLEIIYEDDSIVVINKEAGMIVHPGRGRHNGTLAGALQHHFDTLSDMAGQYRPGIVHRLDRDTSGVIVVARDNQVHHRLSRQFEKREVQKEYRGIVVGEMNLDADHIETHVCVDPNKRERMIICEPKDGSRVATTFYEVEERFRGYTHVKMFPKTGRTHQLRVHMQHLGHPMVADKMYRGGGKLTLAALNASEMKKPLIGRQALHAFRIGFKHPATDKPVSFEAPLPKDMARTLAALREHRS
jgi:23S rRNA pseudouridine1911/1915/1917 synthase